MVLIKLTPAELVEAFLIAYGRAIPKQNFKGQSFAKADSPVVRNVLAHLLGVCGEMGWGKYLGQDIDRTFSLTGDNGIDLKSKYGAIDVKATQYKPPILKLMPKDLNTPVLALAYVVPPRIALMGWVLGERVITRGYERDFGHGNRHCVDAKKLEDCETLRGLDDLKASKRLI